MFIVKTTMTQSADNLVCRTTTNITMTVTFKGTQIVSFSFLKFCWLKKKRAKGDGGEVLYFLTIYDLQMQGHIRPIK